MNKTTTIVLVLIVAAAIAYLAWERHNEQPFEASNPDVLDRPVSASAELGQVMGPSRDANQAFYYPPPLKGMLPVVAGTKDI